ncbi:unnamed protein product, partial [Nesidiocoris tenuis]
NLSVKRIGLSVTQLEPELFAVEVLVSFFYGTDWCRKFLGTPRSGGFLLKIIFGNGFSRTGSLRRPSRQVLGGPAEFRASLLPAVGLGRSSGGEGSL